MLKSKVSKRISGGPCGGIGRRAGFKIQFPQGSASSILAGGTKKIEMLFININNFGTANEKDRVECS